MLEKLFARLKPAAAEAHRLFAGPGEPSRPLQQRDVERMHTPLPSFAALLPWVEFLDKEQAILLSDAISVGAAFDVTAVATEGRSQAWLERLRDSIEDALQDSFEEKASSPWIVQFYCQDSDDLSEYQEHLEHSIAPDIRQTNYTRYFLQQTRRHLQSIAREGGLFQDETITRTAWRGSIRRVRLIVYRWVPRTERVSLYDPSPLEALNTACSRLTAALSSVDVHLERMNQRAFKRWLTAWFNPAPAMTQGDSRALAALLDDDPPDAPDALPLAHGDLAESLLFTTPRSEPASGWYFDGQPHRIVTVEKLRKAPLAGHLTGEIERGDAINALFDLMPEGSILAVTLLVIPQDTLEEHLARLSRKSIGDNIDSLRTTQDCRQAANYLGERHKLYKGNISLFIRDASDEGLRGKYRSLCSALLGAGLEPVREEDEVGPCSSYVRWLPMAFNPLDDRFDWYTRFMFVQHLASLVPLYGRSRGTGTPGLTFFNRGGEPLCFAPTDRRDRQANGHLLVLGPTGAGKSATLVKLMSEVMATVRPRLFVIEAGNSFGLLADDFARHGITVNRLSIKPDGLRQASGVRLSLNPFSEAWKLLEQDNLLLDNDPLLPHDEEDSSDDDDSQRDLLGEMEIAARLMITGGESREIALISRADRSMIREAILLAARHTHATRQQTLPEHVRDALIEISRQSERPARRRDRSAEMAEALELFCQGFEGELFNTPTAPWPDADVTLIDLATFAREGYEGQMAITYIALLNRANNIAEREQHSGRQGIVLTDEGHIITTNPLVAPYAVKITKMWRKLGFWYWIATQNMQDFPDVAKKLLNMIEWWLCLTMPPDEVEEIARFKRLTDAQKKLLLCAGKEPGKYTEGVVLAKKLEALFRVVPPSIYLALGMTEKDEKAERRALMEEHGITELEAACRVAQRIDRLRGIDADDRQ